MLQEDMEATLQDIQNIWVGPWKRKVQSHFWWTGPDFCWNVWLLKNHPAANSPPPPPPSISWFLYKIFREIIFTKNLHYFPLYTPPILLLPSPKNCTFNIPYFVVLLFSYYLLKKKRISYPLHNILTTFYVKSKSPHLLQSR